MISKEKKAQIIAEYGRKPDKIVGIVVKIVVKTK